MLEILETQDFSGPLNSVAVVGGCTPHKDGWMLAEVDFTSPSGDFTLVVECAHYGSDRLDIIDVTAPAGSLHVLAKLFDSEPPSEAEMALVEARGLDSLDIMEPYNLAALRLVSAHYADVARVFA